MKNLFNRILGVFWPKPNWPIIIPTAAGIMMGVLVWLFAIPASGARQGSATFVISAGQGSHAVADNLARANLIPSADIFIIALKALGADSQIKAATYIFPKNVTPASIIYRITEAYGTADDVQVTIPEGYNIWEVDERLAVAGLIAPAQFAAAYAADDGKFFPDTYRFKKGDTVQQIAAKMEDNFDTQTQAFLSGLSSDARAQAIIKASIIEKEAKDFDDMRLVSGVISNRLKQGMDLQIDATVAYGACVRQFAARPARGCDVTQVGVGAEIKIDGPFNTYTRAGLPPRPISNPGLKAIEAAIRPSGDYLFYLSTRDGGQIIFAKTAAEHAANRAKYLGL
ncbi:MAG TPA: endolytic transglycosylase MltG [Candidatus Paceibacterota bacterium]|nr:endolytic transglycosylase MltG [Candidatus Paceibacterota bacterium]